MKLAFNWFVETVEEITSPVVNKVVNVTPYNDGLLAKVTIEEVFKRTRVNVQQKSNNKQTPWDASSLTGNFYFAASTNITTETKEPTIGKAKVQIGRAHV